MFETDEEGQAQASALASTTEVHFLFCRIKKTVCP